MLEKEIVERRHNAIGGGMFMMQCCGEHFPDTPEAIALHESDGNCQYAKSEEARKDLYVYSRTE